MMNNNILMTTAVVVAAMFLLFGTGYADGFGSHGETRAETSAHPAASGEITPDASTVVLSGTIDDYGLLVDPLGDTFRLADSGQGMEVKSLIGKVVKIEGTVMQVQGEREVAVNRFTILE